MILSLTSRGVAPFETYDGMFCGGFDGMREGMFDGTLDGSVGRVGTWASASVLVWCGPHAAPRLFPAAPSVSLSCASCNRLPFTRSGGETETEEKKK